MTMQPVPDAARQKAGAANVVLRIISACAGIVLFIAGAVVTLGVAPLALIALVIIAVVMRRRGKPLTMMSSWLVCGIAAMAIAVLGSGIVYLSLSDEFIAQVKAAGEAAEDRPPPEWLGEFGSPADVDPGVAKVIESRPFTLYFGILGGSMALLMLGGFFGTITWVTALLFGFAIRGRRPFDSPAVSESDAFIPLVPA